jgi:hypothetical protein
LAVALVAFIVDTVFLRGEGRVQQAGAEIIEPIGPAAQPAIITTEPVPPVQPQPEDTPSLTVALKACEAIDIAEIPEAFQPSESWLQALCPPPPADAEIPELLPVPTGNEPPADDAMAILRARRFAKAHSLMSIIRTSNGGTALVDGQLVQVGGKLDGFTLVSLTERGAVFEADGRQIELRLSKDQR